MYFPVTAPSNACLYRIVCCEHTQLPAVEEVGVYEMCIISNVIVIAVQSVRSTRVQLYEHDDSCQPVRSTEARGALQSQVTHMTMRWRPGAAPRRPLY